MANLRSIEDELARQQGLAIQILVQVSIHEDTDTYEIFYTKLYDGTIDLR